MGKRKKENDTFYRKKAEEKQNSATIMISVDGRGTFFQCSWNYKENRLKKSILKKRVLK